MTACAPLIGDTAPIASGCDCGENELCIFCGACVRCESDKARCDASDHCDDPMCLAECSLCRREMRP